MTKTEFKKHLKGRKAYIRVQGTESCYVDVSRAVALEIYDYMDGDIALFIDGPTVGIETNAMQLYGHVGVTYLGD